MTQSDSHNSLFREIVEMHDVGKALALGPYANVTWQRDPRGLLFGMARYKFCAKILAGAKNVLEVGCGDAFASALILQSVDKFTGIDIEPGIIDYNKKHYKSGDRTRFLCHDIGAAPLTSVFDAGFSLDVLEHIPTNHEDRFIANMASSLLPHAPCIIGTPNITSAAYACEASEREHINLKDHRSLRNLLKRYYHNVFIFSMNDEVVHTGFYPMAHYLLALAVSPISPAKVREPNEC